MAGRYGMSFAAKMIQEGKYAEAIEEATRAVARDEEDPAPLVERASAYAWLERYPEAVKDLEAAIALDETAGVLETDVVDDAYFSALLGAAKLEARTLAGGARPRRWRATRRSCRAGAIWPTPRPGPTVCERRAAARDAGAESRRPGVARAAPARVAACRRAGGGAADLLAEGLSRHQHPRHHRDGRHRPGDVLSLLRIQARDLRRAPGWSGDHAAGAGQTDRGRPGRSPAGGSDERHRRAGAADAARQPRAAPHPAARGGGDRRRLRSQALRVLRPHRGDDHRRRSTPGGSWAWCGRATPRSSRAACSEASKRSCSGRSSSRTRRPSR